MTEAIGTETKKEEMRSKKSVSVRLGKTHVRLCSS